MKSIRLSLLVYFLMLLALALTAAFGLAYQSAAQSLQAKEDSTRSLLEAQYDSRCRDTLEELDRHLLDRANALAKLAHSEGVFQPQAELSVLGLLGTLPSPCGYVFAPAWFVGRMDGSPVRIPRYRPTIRLEDSAEVLTEERENPEYFQVYSQAGVPLHRSATLEDSAFFLDPGLQQRLGLLEWYFDEAESPLGEPLRRVTLKAPVMITRFGSRPTRPESGGPTPFLRRFRSPPPRPNGRTGPTDLPVPTMFIQYAADKSQADADLAAFKDEHATGLAKLEAETRDALTILRARLLIIALLTFAATVLGGRWLIGVGLAPLGRLSEAVSRVSVKELRLPFEAAQMPRELKPIVSRLTQTFGLLERAFVREKQAAADISHELRTPVSVLLTTTEVALRKPRTPEQYREALADCRATGQQMNVLVERLLTLARIDAGVDSFRPQEVDAAAVAEQCAGLVRPLAEARGLRFEVVRDGPAQLTTDPDKLREVLNNLLHNAIEYNRPDGRVTLSVARQNGHVRLEVSDTGIGIAPEMRKHIFERFYRGDPSRQADGLHTGLGLAIVKGYVELMGGRIDVDSVPDQGSTFRVELPA